MSRPDDLDGTWNRPLRRPQLPLLDRLFDADPDSREDRAPGAAAALAALRASLRHDLEALLNSRRRWRSLPPSLKELPRSCVGFGLPEFVGGGFNDPRRGEELRAEVEATIRRFEPRLTSLSVSLINAQDRLSGTLRFRIEGLLHADPAPEPVSFETRLETGTADITVLAEG